MTLPFTLRLATADDIPTMARHRRRMFEDMGDSDAELLAKMEPEFKQWVRKKLKSNEYLGWFAIDPETGEIAGGAALWLTPWIPGPNAAIGGPVPGVRPYLLNVYTEPDYRRRGAARFLVTSIIEWCRQQGFNRMILHASDEGRPLYESLGFKGTNEMRLDL